MENMLALLEQIEVIALEGGYDFELLSKVYEQLIEDGYLPSEVDTIDKVEDVFLIDYEYEFSDEENLTDLAQSIALIAGLDSEVEEDEETEIEGKEPENTYYIQKVMATTGFMLDEDELVEQIFHSLDDVAEYVSEVVEGIALYYMMEEVDCTVGVTELIDAESARELFSQEGHPFEILVDEIQEEAIAVCVVVHYEGDSDEIQILEMFIIYEVE